MPIKPFLFAALLLASVSAPTLAYAQAAGAAAPPPPADAPKVEETRPEAAPGTVDLLRLVTVRTPRQDMRPAPLDGYVRFYICDPSQCGEAEPISRGARDYQADHRDWVSRWLMGRSYSRILTLKLTVTRPDFTATTTLASSGFQSNSTVGETWNSELNGRTYLTPYIRVDAATQVRIQVSMDASSRVQSNVSRAVLDVVGRAAALIQPGTQLVTSLTTGRFRQTSDFVDQSVSALFAQNLAERSSNDFEPTDWSGKPMVDIVAHFPMNRNVLRSADYMNIGQWRVMATPARFSMFSDMQMAEGDRADAARCPGVSPANVPACLAFRNVTPQRVLGFNVGDDLTLGEVLGGDPEISSEASRLLTATGDARQTSARRLCLLVSSKAEEVGLNRYDAAAAVWAFSEVMQLDRERRGFIMSANDSCAAAAVVRDTNIGGGPLRDRIANAAARH